MCWRRANWQLLYSKIKGQSRGLQLARKSKQTLPRAEQRIQSRSCSYRIRPCSQTWYKTTMSIKWADSRGRQQIRGSWTLGKQNVSGTLTFNSGDIPSAFPHLVLSQHSDQQSIILAILNLKYKNYMECS